MTRRQSASSVRRAAAAFGLVCAAAASAGPIPGSRAPMDKHMDFQASPVQIHINAAKQLSPVGTHWAYFGYDEANFTTAPNGRLLMRHLAALSPVPVTLRCHNLLTSGDGVPALKWSSTNAYTEDAAGNPVYNWTILDGMFDAYRDAGIRPLVEIGFMPEALSTHPVPYRHHWPKTTLATGWAYPPKSYEKWAGLVHAWVTHCVERYGRKAVATWLWEVWNEPDISYWQGSPQEYFKLYDFSADAVKRALPEAKIGGADSTGPRYPHAAAFMQSFLQHCATGTNAVTGHIGSPLDFILFHAKGEARYTDGHVRMGLGPHLQSVDNGFQIVASFPQYKHTPIVIGESDPEGTAALASSLHPENGYRNGTQYAAYEAALYACTLQLAALHGVNLMGAVTWAFEFEDQPLFYGYRELATGGIDKPVLNTFRMLGQMRGNALPVETAGEPAATAVTAYGVRGDPYVGAQAARNGREVTALVFNYHDDAAPADAAAVALTVSGLPATLHRVLVRHYRIDHAHSNSYTEWNQMGSPAAPTADQMANLKQAGELEQLAAPEWHSVSRGELALTFELPRQAVSLVQISW